MAWRDLARVLLTMEMGDQTSLAALPAAAERAFQKLCRLLAELVTRTGCQALVARALHLTRFEFPFLAGVRATTNRDVPLEGLQESLGDVEPAHAHEGLVLLLANLIALLVTFIGEGVTLRLLADVWPDMPREQPGSERREA
ncbi:MAG: hypothetical protein DLM70_15780 [Chloroflexi bacterium]|nr:MAG: hypothetical protein DLM70_15780 [Chloroflexota bacterium]